MSEDARQTWPVTDESWKALQGAYDLHVHVAPDIIERRIDDLDLAQEFLARGMNGFVLKSHYVPTADRAKVVSKAIKGIAAYGAIALNHSVGGLNPLAIEIAGRSGCKVVWLPTVDAANETAGRLDSTVQNPPFWAKIQRELAAIRIAPPPISVLNDSGTISGTTRTCLELIAKHDMAVATGHLSREEIRKLVPAARDSKVRKIIITHAEFPSQDFSAEEQVDLAAEGALIEHCFTTMFTGKKSWDTVIENIRKVGVEHSILSTDSGQKGNPPVSECFAMFVQRLLDAQFSIDQIQRMVAINTRSLLE